MSRPFITRRRSWSFAAALLMIAAFIFAAARGQEAKTAYTLKAPEDWNGEQIKLPPGFAPKMGFKGREDIRFVPGMFKEKSSSFFSYAVLFWLEPGSDVSEKKLKREIEVYYQGLSEAVLKGRNSDQKAAQVKVAMKASKSKKRLDKRQNHQPKRYQGELSWTEPFVTAKSQRLSFEVDVWTCENEKRDCVFLIVSPQAAGSPVWTELRKIRKDFRCHATADKKGKESSSPRE